MFGESPNTIVDAELDGGHQLVRLDLLVRHLQQQNHTFSYYETASVFLIKRSSDLVSTQQRELQKYNIGKKNLA